ncbi:hypothetical protein G7081_06715 [Vagococcus coleopterorum]|uniref:Mga helix-turn-helix domain-containing protein n=1 Tax=Vagococcus coleopterorum TaxID=2714946 RepID=A0A6G8ANX3_9ENTE|nr:hypothetical protein [Vagococcus coleopterorum]QIL46778.1 hypothetical protein G7081_06715 [Vagococcus coleopterorum]
MFIHFLSKKNVRKLNILNDILGLSVFSKSTEKKANRDYHELMEDLKRNGFENYFDFSNVHFVFVGETNMKFLILNKIWSDYLKQSAMYLTMKEIVVKGNTNIPYLEKEIQYSTPYIYSMIDKMNKFPSFIAHGIKLKLEKGQVNLVSEKPFNLYFFILMWYKQTPLTPVLPISAALKQIARSQSDTPLNLDKDSSELLQIIAPEVKTREEFYVMLCSYFYNDHHGIAESYVIGDKLLRLDNQIIKGLVTLIKNFEAEYPQIIERDYGIYVYSLVMFIMLYGQSKDSIDILKGHLDFYHQLHNSDEAEIDNKLFKVIEKSKDLPVFNQNKEVYSVMLADINPILEATMPQPKITIYVSIKESPFLELLVKDSIINNFNHDRFEFVLDRSKADAYIIDRFQEDQPIEKQYLLKNYINEITEKNYLTWLVQILLHKK